MKVTVFGTGYVGLVTGVCLAEVGNQVLCYDIDSAKIEQLKNGKVPIYEPGLEAMLVENLEAGRLKFTTDVVEAVEFGLFLFLAVGTPPDEDGSANLSFLMQAAAEIGRCINEYRIVINKSTVPVGTAEEVAAAIQQQLDVRDSQVEFDVVSNPEFLKEGDAISDFMKPDRIIIGTNNPRTTELLKVLYQPFNRNHNRMIVMDVRSSELTKYAANAMLATKISFMNELANIADRLGVDIENVRLGIGSDTRIGYHFIYPGCGFGGSCFPKDLRALERSAQRVGYQAELIQAVSQVNQRQKNRLFERIFEHFEGELAGKCFALWGLAFKPNTDDIREAPSLVLIDALLSAGAKVRAYDPEAMGEASKIYGEEATVELAKSAYDAVEGADALVVVTEWKIFRSPDFDRIKKALLRPLIFDGRNLYDPFALSKRGFDYYGMGRNMQQRPEHARS